MQLNYFKSYWSFNGFIRSYILGSHIYYKNLFSAWQISGYDTGIKTVSGQNELVEFADDLTLAVPGYDYGDTSMIEVGNIREWCERNRMQLNLEKTYEMVLMSKISTPLPAAIPNINRKTCGRYWESL